MKKDTRQNFFFISLELMAFYLPSFVGDLVNVTYVAMQMLSNIIIFFTVFRSVSFRSVTTYCLDFGHKADGNLTELRQVIGYVDHFWKVTARKKDKPNRFEYFPKISI